MRYRLADPVINEAQYDLVKEVLDSKYLVHGDKCERFENKIGQYLGIDASQVAVTSSCTASLHLALMALDLKPGEGVLVSNFTFPATVNVIEVMGAVPIFVDVEDGHYCMDPNKLTQAIQTWQSKLNLKGIVLVHEFGAAGQIKEIARIAKDHNMFLLEDAACAFGTEAEGAKVGLLSDIGCFSFHPRKAITTGEGGAVVSNRPELIERVKMLRNHGMAVVDGALDFVMPGLNYRLTNIQAALGIIQIDLFDQWIAQRRVLQDAYRNSLQSADISLPLEQKGHTWQSFMVVLDSKFDRKKLIGLMREKGIETNYGAYSTLDTSYYSKKYKLDYPEGMPVSMNLFKHGLCLPLHQNLSIEDVQFISETLLSCLKACEV